MGTFWPNWLGFIFFFVCMLLLLEQEKELSESKDEARMLSTPSQLRSGTM